LWLNGKSQGVGDGTVRLALAVNSNRVSIYNGLATVVNKKFQTISGHISETARDRPRAKVAIDH